MTKQSEEQVGFREEQCCAIMDGSGESRDKWESD